MAAEVQDGLRGSNPPVVNPWIVSISVMFATFMEVLDTTVVNVSLPHIAGSLSASVDEATWALTSYLVANAIILPITGWLASYVGRKRLLLASIIGFTASSFLCGLAPNLTVLVICRVLQGATGGCLQPISQAVMLEAFPPAERGKAMAFWGLGIVVARKVGPAQRGSRLLGPGVARCRHRHAADHAGQRAGSRLVCRDLGAGVCTDFGRDAGRVCHSGAACGPSGGGAARAEGAYLRDGRVPDDHARLRALRQYGAAAAAAADAARVSLAECWHCHVSPGPGVVPDDACGGTGHGAGGSAQASPGRTAGCGEQPVLAFQAEHAARLLGYFLAAVAAGAGAVAGVRAADDGDHGSDPGRADGQCHQHLQPDAQHRWQRGHCADRYLGGAAHPAEHQSAGPPRQSAQPRGADAL